jgi:hypothetical protein
MESDNRDLERCTSCNHLTVMHAGQGCFACSLGQGLSLSLVKCQCIRTPETASPYRGAPTFEEIAVNLSPTPSQDFNESEGYWDGFGYFHYYK